MKLVINKCYGGYGLSIKAVKELLKRKKQKAWFYEMDTSSPASKRIWNRVSEKTSIFIRCVAKDLGPQATDSEINKAPHLHYFSFPGRADPDLIAVVEKLGKEANGTCADLKIVEIPDGVDYEIEEYDGMESVHEKHRSWR